MLATRLGLLGRIWVPCFANFFCSFRFFMLSSNGMFSTSSFLEKPGAGKIRWYFDEVSRLGWYVILPDLMSHPVYEGKPNASHMCARISLHTYD